MTSMHSAERTLPARDESVSNAAGGATGSIGLKTHPRLRPESWLPPLAAARPRANPAHHAPNPTMSRPLDPRFAKLTTDPRFQRPKASKNKIVVDDRFKEFFGQREWPAQFKSPSSSVSFSGPAYAGARIGYERIDANAVFVLQPRRPRPRARRVRRLTSTAVRSRPTPRPTT